jgi:hypothetical protein
MKNDLSKIIFIHLWLYSTIWALATIIWFPNQFSTYGRTPWASDQFVARFVPTQENTTQKDHGKIYMP